MQIQRDFKTGLILGLALVIISIILMSIITHTTEKQNKFELHQAGEYVYLLNFKTGELWLVKNGDQLWRVYNVD